MVWGGIFSLGKTKLFVMDEKVNSLVYTQILGDYLLPFANATYGDDFIFQQDNCSVHKSRDTKQYLQEEGVEVLEWPSKSPDLNPIENLWGILVRMVYNDGKKRYKNKAELREALILNWSKIRLSTVHKLVSTMPDRCMEIIERKGWKIHY